MLSHAPLSQALERIGAAPSPRVLWEAVKAFAASLGYTHMTVADATKRARSGVHAMLYCEAPFTRAGADCAGREKDMPFVVRALSSPEPFLVSELPCDPYDAGRPWTLTDGDAKRGDGLVVPVYDGDKPLASFMFGGAEPDISILSRSMLSIISHFAIGKLRAPHSASPAAVLLSARETQCLRLIAAGKSDGDVARILGISPRTVRFHVDGVKRKLGTHSRIVAVAQALHEKIVLV